MEAVTGRDGHPPRHISDVLVMPVDQRLALRLQLAAIAGDEPASSFIEIRPLRRDGRPAVRERGFVPVRELGAAAERCRDLAATHNAFVGVAPRTRLDGTAASVARVWCLWADIDGPDALARLRAFTPLPSIVIRTGSDASVHAYWPLRVPLGAQWGVRANRRLATALGSDIAATDAARILRPAGTLNHKHAPPRDVVCTRLETDVFTFAEVVGRLPDDRPYGTQPITRPATTTPANALEALSNVVRAAAVGNRNRALFWAACRVREHGDNGTLDVDAARQVLCDAAVAAGLTEDEAQRTIRSGLNSSTQAIAA